MSNCSNKGVYIYSSDRDLTAEQCMNVEWHDRGESCLHAGPQHSEHHHLVYTIWKLWKTKFTVNESMNHTWTCTHTHTHTAQRFRSAVNLLQRVPPEHARPSLIVNLRSDEEGYSFMLCPSDGECQPPTVSIPPTHKHNPFKLVTNKTGCWLWLIPLYEVYHLNLGVTFTYFTI